MSTRSLGDVLADVIDGCRRHPALWPHVFHALMDGGGMRDGMLDVVTQQRRATDDAGANAVHLDLSVHPSAWLVRFAHAVAQGVVPEMPLPPKAVPCDDHDSEPLVDVTGVTVAGGPFQRIPEYLNTE